MVKFDSSIFYLSRSGVDGGLGRGTVAILAQVFSKVVRPSRTVLMPKGCEETRAIAMVRESRSNASIHNSTSATAGHRIADARITREKDNSRADEIEDRRQYVRQCVQQLKPLATHKKVRSSRARPPRTINKAKQEEEKKVAVESTARLQTSGDGGYCSF